MSIDFVLYLVYRVVSFFCMGFVAGLLFFELVKVYNRRKR